MKRVAIALLTLAIPLQAMALTARDILSLVAMPLAVAAVSDVTSVPQDQLAALATELNQANVPPDQFVQLLRYTPPALVLAPNPQQPTLVEFVQTQQTQGVTGPALVTAVEQQLPVYGVTPVLNLDVPATTLVEQIDYIPANIVTRLGGTTDPLAWVAMPLAVAAVSDLTGVPQDQLANLAATLNQADVPPAQFVQVMRYVPVALVTQIPQQPTFVEYVEAQQAQGVTGPALVSAIYQQLPNYGIPPQTLVAPAPAGQTITVNGNYFPPVVRTRVAEAENNPHGGPPGQLKRIYGVQTGAEVVHGMKPGRQFGVPEGPPAIAEQPVIPGHHGNPHGMPPGQARRLEQLPPPMISSGAPPVAHVPPGRAKRMGEAPAGHIPPGQAKKMGGPPMVMMPQAAPGPPAGMPPGLAKKEGGGGPPGGVPPGQAKKGGEGHGHEKD